MTLPTVVKKFVEANIDYIENNDWESLFKNWYIFGNEYYWEELIECLEAVEPNILELSRKEREHVLFGIGKALMANLIQMGSRITVGSVLEATRCTLGFDDDELENILNKAAESEGLARATNGWYRV